MIQYVHSNPSSEWDHVLSCLLRRQYRESPALVQTENVRGRQPHAQPMSMPSQSLHLSEVPAAENRLS